MAAIELITKDDLVAFKADLLQEIRTLLKPENPRNRQWIKSNEVRKLLCISPGTLQNLRINGTLKYSKVGSIFYYKQEDIQVLLEAKNE